MSAHKGPLQENTKLPRKLELRIEELEAEVKRLRRLLADVPDYLVMKERHAAGEWSWANTINSFEAEIAAAWQLTGRTHAVLPKR